jgi:hypothetical protein
MFMNNLEKYTGKCTCGKVRSHNNEKQARIGLCH